MKFLKQLFNKLFGKKPSIKEETGKVVFRRVLPTGWGDAPAVHGIEHKESFRRVLPSGVKQ